MRKQSDAQILVGIPRDSDMHQFYLQEAEEQGVKLPTFIYQLLKDRYEALHGGGRCVWFPRGMMVPPPPQQVLSTKPTSPDKVNAALQMFGGEDED